MNRKEIPEIGEIWTLHGVDVEVTDMNPEFPKNSELVFGDIELTPLDGGSVQHMALGDFFENGFKFKSSREDDHDGSGTGEGSRARFEKDRERRMPESVDKILEGEDPQKIIEDEGKSD